MVWCGVTAPHRLCAARLTARASSSCARTADFSRISSFRFHVDARDSNQDCSEACGRIGWGEIEPGQDCSGACGWGEMELDGRGVVLGGAAGWGGAERDGAARVGWDIIRGIRRSGWKSRVWVPSFGRRAPCS